MRADPDFDDEIQSHIDLLTKRLIAKGTPPVQHINRFDPNLPLESLTSLERVERMVALGMDE